MKFKYKFILTEKVERSETDWVDGDTPLIAGWLGKQKGHFILDTGATGGIFETKNAKKGTLKRDALQLLSMDSHRKMKMHIGDTSITFDKKLTLELQNQCFIDGLDFDAKMMQEGYTILGLLGSDFFRMAKAVIDFENLELRIDVPVE